MNKHMEKIQKEQKKFEEEAKTTEKTMLQELVEGKDKGIIENDVVLASERK